LSFRPTPIKKRYDDMFRELVLNQKLWRGETVSVPNGAGIPTKVSILPVTICLTDQSGDTFLHAGCLGFSLFTAKFALRHALTEFTRSS
jgi:hypothetical protein